MQVLGHCSLLHPTPFLGISAEEEPPETLFQTWVTREKQKPQGSTAGVPKAGGAPKAGAPVSLLA